MRWYATILRTVLFAGVLFLMAHPCRAQAGCGATTGGAGQYDQSACGNVPPFPAPPANPTPVSSCETLAAGTYQLTGNLTSAATATCLILKGAVVLDFAGFTITGRIIGSGIDMSGMHLYSSAPGGGITCADSSSTTPGCIFLGNSGSPLNTPLEVDHLTLSNTDNTSANSARDLMIDWEPISSSLGRAFGVKIHNITGVSATGTSSGRIGIIWVTANANANLELNNNKLTCQSNASSCNAVSFWKANDAKVHNNLFVNQQANPIITGDTARAVVCDGGGHGCEGYNNYFDAEDGRAWRLRRMDDAYDAVSFHDNQIDNIIKGSTGNYVAAIHVCDPDSGVDNGAGYVFQNNTLKIANGNGLMSRNCANFPVFRNNTIQCLGTCTGRLAYIRTPVAGATTTTFELDNNDVVPLTSNPQIEVQSGAVANVCKSGTAGGTGTINYPAC